MSCLIATISVEAAARKPLVDAMIERRRGAANDNWGFSSRGMKNNPGGNASNVRVPQTSTRTTMDYINAAKIGQFPWNGGDTFGRMRRGAVGLSAGVHGRGAVVGTCGGARSARGLEHGLKKGFLDSATNSAYDTSERMQGSRSHYLPTLAKNGPYGGMGGYEFETSLNVDGRHHTTAPFDRSIGVRSEQTEYVGLYNVDGMGQLRSQSMQGYLGRYCDGFGGTGYGETHVNNQDVEAENRRASLNEYHLQAH